IDILTIRLGRPSWMISFCGRRPMEELNLTGQDEQPMAIDPTLAHSSPGIILSPIRMHLQYTLHIPLFNHFARIALSLSLQGLLPQYLDRRGILAQFTAVLMSGLGAVIALGTCLSVLPI